MPYEPRFTISPDLLGMVEEITSFREKIMGASVGLSWIPALQKDSRTRNVHASTAIEGNPLTLAQVRALSEGRELASKDQRAKREVLNYFAGLRYISEQADTKAIRHTNLFELHRMLAEEVMDQGSAGQYRDFGVQVGIHVPPPASKVKPLMSELLSWWNKPALSLSPILSSAILHYRFEYIHPFADGNGRTGRALALWDLYRRGFDTHHLFSIDEYYWEDRMAYYSALEEMGRHEGDLTSWVEYCTTGLLQTLRRVWLRVQKFQSEHPEKLTLTRKQEHLLELLSDHRSMAPAEIWAAMKISKQGAMNLINPLLEAGIIEKTGTKKSGRYSLRRS